MRVKQTNDVYTTVAKVIQGQKKTKIGCKMCIGKSDES